MNFEVRRHGAEEFARVLLRAWRCDPREKIRFRAEIAGEQGILLLNPTIKQVRSRRRTPPDQTSTKSDCLLYDLPVRDTEALLGDLALFTGAPAARIRMISRPSNVEIAVLNRVELHALAKFAASKNWRALLPFIFPPQSEWRASVFLDGGPGRFAKCHVWLPAAEVKRLVLERPESAGSLLAVRCPGVEAELPLEEQSNAIVSGLTPATPAQSSLQNCPRCNGQTELNGDGNLICHFCGQTFHPSAATIPVAA